MIESEAKTEQSSPAEQLPRRQLRRGMGGHNKGKNTMIGLRNITLVALLLGASALVSTGVSAHEKQDAADVKLLRDAATALQQSRPDLAQGLSKLADEEFKELNNESKEESEKEERSEKAKARAEHQKNANH